MKSDSKDLIVLGAIMRGERKFDKIKKTTQIDAKELNSILEKLEVQGLITVQEKKGLLGSKIEIFTTENGRDEVDKRVHEMQEKWNQMSQIYKTGDKSKLKQYMGENKSMLPSMMFFGVMDMMMFGMMFGMMGSMMTDYVPQESIPDGLDSDGMDGDADVSDGGFDFDMGF